MRETLTIIPTYNERENIERLVETVLAQDARLDVLVIDDGSPDGTGEIADDLARRSRRVRVIHREGKLGLGTAIVRGLTFAREQGYEGAIVMDADFSHDPGYIGAFLERAEEYDLVIGSRYVPGGGVENWGVVRRLVSRLTNVASRLLLRIPAKDVTGAFRCYRVGRLGELRLETVVSRGFSIQEELAMRCARARWRMTEVPIVFVDRKRGESKVSMGEIARSLATLLALAFRRGR
ncbi:MAG: polyprenol monophosphomannose synthase [Planctomycetota bacterium]